MKTKLKFFKVIVLFALFSAFYSCQVEELIIENDNKSFELKTSKISINQVINEINSQSFKQKLQNKNYDSSISNALHRTNDSEVYFIKKEKDDELTSYILHLNSYSQSKPYFLKLIITQNNNETERMGYIKYIPTSPVSILDMSTFSGEVQILVNNFEVNAASNYVNGVKQENVQNNGTQNRIICTDEIVITEEKCSNGGGHGVGDSCDGDLVNDAHFVISVTTVCTGRSDQLVQIIEDYSNPNTDGATSVNVGMALADNFANTQLTPVQKLIYDLNPSIREYLANNIIIVPQPNYNPLLGGDPTMAAIDPQAVQFVTELIDLANQDTNVDNNAVNFVIKAKSQNLMEAELNDNFLQSVDNLLELNTATIDPIVMAQIQMYFTAKCAVLRYNHPTWSDLKIYYEASKELIHIALDGFGLIPVVGEIADLTNGVLYLIEGDGVNATLSFAATIPVAGWTATGAKYAFKLKAVSTIGTKVKLTWKVLSNGKIYFGANSTCRSQLRKVLGLAVGNADQAHHIIPLNLQLNEVVQRAAKSGSSFHMNEELNGIALSTLVHNGSHSLYDGKITQKLNTFLLQNPNATPDQCYIKIYQVIQEIRTAIANNPTTPINQLNF